MTEYLSVSQLTKYLKLKFDRDPYLERVYLTGEVSNFRRRPTHQYFSLKDEKAVIQATIWGGVYKNLGFELEEGMKINVIGRVQLYEPSGSYSIVIEKAHPIIGNAQGQHVKQRQIVFRRVDRRDGLRPQRFVVGQRIGVV